MVSPEEPDGTELLLSAADGAARDFQKASKAAGKPAISLTTDDIERDHQRLAAAGVTFVMEPTKMGYGDTDALFDDGCGNLINLHME